MAVGNFVRFDFEDISWVIILIGDISYIFRNGHYSLSLEFRRNYLLWLERFCRGNIGRVVECVKLLIWFRINI